MALQPAQWDEVVFEEQWVGDFVDEGQVLRNEELYLVGVAPVY